MSDTTIPARLVAEGVGLPAVWRLDRPDKSGPFAYELVIRLALAVGQDVLAGDIDLSDPQTAFGVALRLDEWERAGGKVAPDLWDAEGHHTGRPSQEWACRVALCEPIEALAARVRQIGMDHAIRRALGWEVEPGTLMVLRHRRHPDGFDIWEASQDGRDPVYGRIRFTSGAAQWLNTPSRNVPALEGITDPAEALAAIYAEVCGGA